MNVHERFVTFCESLLDEGNQQLLESVLEGYLAIMETRGVVMSAPEKAKYRWEHKPMSGSDLADSMKGGIMGRDDVPHVLKLRRMGRDIELDPNSASKAFRGLQVKDLGSDEYAEELAYRNSMGTPVEWGDTWSDEYGFQ